MVTLDPQKHTSMPEQAYTPPETKYEVHIDELMKAIRGEDFVQGNVLWRMRGEKIDCKELFGDSNIYFAKMQKYVMLTQAIVTNAGAIELITDLPTNYDIGFIFHKSILPGIRLRNTKIADWYYNNSQSAYISLEDGCQTSDIRIYGNSQAGDINICKNSQVFHIIINNNSQAGKIRIDQDSQAGDIMVDNKSQTGDISIHSNSQTGDIWIDNKSQMGTIWIDKYSQAAIIRVYQSSKAGNIRIDNNSIARNIGIDYNSKVDNIQVSGNSKARHIRIDNNSQAGNIGVLGKSQTGDIWIKSHSQAGNINISNSHSGHIFINNQSHSEDIWVENNSQSGNIKIYDNKQPINLYIKHNSQTGNLLSIDAKLEYVEINNNCLSIQLHNTSLLRMALEQCLIAEFIWGACTKGEVYISGKSRVLPLRMAATSLSKDSVLSLTDTQLQYGILQKVLVQGNLLLGKVGPPQIPFVWQDITAYIGEVPMNELQKELWNGKKELFEQQVKQYGINPLFRINHSSLGKTEITGCDLTGFKFEYYNSKLLDCFITGTQLPKDNIAIYNTAAPGTQVAKKDEYEQKTSIYNQFKKIYENQGDVVEASEYHAMAMRYQQKLLRSKLWGGNKQASESWWRNIYRWCYEKGKLLWHKLRFWRPILRWLERYFDYLGFLLNRLSNNHGESWSRALFFTIGASLIFFTASLWGLTHFWDWKVFNDNIHKLPGFILPIHKIDFLSEDIVKANPSLKVSLWHTTWDFLGRIFIGYGFFQFIAAFRRHGKKAG
jgi:hypothetical protein